MQKLQDVVHPVVFRSRQASMLSLGYSAAPQSSAAAEDIWVALQRC